MNSGTDRDEATVAALDLWLDFLSARPGFLEADFEALCVRNPNIESELRVLRKSTPGLASNALPPAQGEATGELLARLTRLSLPCVRGARYVHESELGRGGTGVVRRVRDVELNRLLAHKQLSAGSAVHHPLAAARFLEEAHVTAQLDHPGIVPLHELGVDADGRLYFTMKLVNGHDLREILEEVGTGQSDWSQTRLLGVLLRVCEAVAYAHSKGVVHRDLKPSNVMVGHFGEVYVMDWGLARVMGRQDLHDIRLKIGLVTESLHTNLREEREETPDSPLVTMDGVVVGTPAYMPPEQACGEIQLLSARSDVYSIGAILYHLLTGEPPYVRNRARISAHTLVARVIEGPPRPVVELAPGAAPELVAICERAMARAPAQRYTDTLALGDELRAYLEHRVVRAHRTGPVVELRKWVRRNRALATTGLTALLALIGALVAALVLQGQSEHNAVLAMEAGRVAERRGEDVLRLAAFQRLEELKKDEPLLWPPVPRLLPRFDAWLARSRALVEELDPKAGGYPGHRAKLAELEARAEAPSAEEAERLLHENALFPELESLRKQLANLELRLAARAGRAPSDLAPPAESSVPALLARAWSWVDPERVVLGEEGRGLALAQLAFARIDGDQQFAEASRILAWALFANGQDGAAFQKLDAALQVSPGELLAPLTAARKRLAAEIAAQGGLTHARTELAARIDALEESLGAHSRLRFASPEDEWLHRQLTRLTKELEDFARPEAQLGRPWSVEKRREFAATLVERSLSGEDARRRWAEACAAIADERASPAYRGLRLEPQLGLLPIGRDPASKLWEFAHLMSGTAPTRDASGHLVLSEDSGIVLVLLPGGTFTMGAQARMPEDEHYDPWAESIEGPPHEVQISPFFLAKHELTQGQWLRLTGSNPSQDSPETYERSWNADGAPGNLLHPVEHVSWDECMAVCAKLALTLPSEAQWEYAARGGTSTRWWTGDEPETLDGALNVADVRVAGMEKLAPFYDAGLDDGQVSHAPIGSYRANPFGLHDVLGNVWEWCLDGYDEGFFNRSPHLDPVLDPLMSPLRTARGGGFTDPLRKARVTQRVDGLSDKREMFLGLRAARALDSPAR